MNDRTLARTEQQSGYATQDDSGSQQPAAGPASGHPVADPSLAIAVAATFTADPLVAPLEFWMRTLEIPATVAVAPYGQLLQELLDPRSLLSGSRCNILLLRPEDWARNLPQQGSAGSVLQIRRVADELVDAVLASCTRTSAETIAILCPPSAAAVQTHGVALERIECDLLSRLNVQGRVQCFGYTEVTRLYPVSQHEDASADRIGHIPYTTEYFTALATLSARRIAHSRKAPYKVIALDCDNTLWKGVCGEDGPAGVELTPAHLQFQKLLLRQHDAGVLLCLCSKNNEADVAAVFNSRPTCCCVKST